MKVKDIIDRVPAAISAGIFISLGATVSITVESPVISALLFTIGLCSVLVFNADLFTGKCSYLVDSDSPLSYSCYLLVVWLGNLIGCGIIAVFLRCTSFLTRYQVKISELLLRKLSLPLFDALIFGVLCGALMYIAVDGFNRCKENNPLLGSTCYILAVVTFILCGFEHCVADMFYILLNGSIKQEQMTFLLTVTAGNLLGGNFLRLLTPSSEQKK